MPKKNTPPATPKVAPATRKVAPLTADTLAKAERVDAYRHPDTARTVAYHADGYAYTITGLPAGKATLKTEN